MGKIKRKCLFFQLLSQEGNPVKQSKSKFFEKVQGCIERHIIAESCLRGLWSKFHLTEYVGGCMNLALSIHKHMDLIKRSLFFKVCGPQFPETPLLDKY